MHRTTRTPYLIAIFVPVILFTYNVVNGQSSTSGAIRGIVSDPQGAVLPGSLITVTSQATAAKRTAISDGHGEYAVGLLPPGIYTVSFEANGFKTVVPPAVTVIVTETAQLNASMVVGDKGETVEVTAGAALLQSDNATLGTLVDSKTIQAVPLTTRNYTQVLTMSPGVASDPNSAASLGKGTPDVYVNGGSNISNSFHMDGADINNFGSGRAGDFVQQAGIAIPNPDALQEFKIQTTQYDAAYGRDAGANVDVITRSGTNQFHGAIFEFFRNDIFNANDSFLKAGGQPRPAMKQNQFGGTLGGPLLKDRVFFFGSYQGTRQVNGLSPLSLSSNTLPALTGNRTAAGLGAQFCAANNPLLTTAHGGVQVACDGSNISPVAIALLNQKISNGNYLIPTPQRYITTATGAPAGFSTYSIPADFTEDQYLANLDYVISSKHRLDERYFFSRDPQVQPFSACTAGCPPGAAVNPNFTSHVADLKLTSALTANFLNEGLLAFVRSTGKLTGDSNIPAASVGITPGDPTYPLMPLMTVNGSFSLGGGPNDRQSFRAGFMGEKQFFNYLNPTSRRGTLTFLTFQDFLLGMSAAQNGSQYSNVYQSNSAQGNYYKAFRATDISGFVQDDVKLTRTLTGNFGLRWELNGGISDAHGNLTSVFTSIMANSPAPTAAGTYAGFVVPSNFNGPLPQGVTRLDGKTLADDGMPLHNFGPRIGFAWQADGATVLRGGAGIFYTMPNGNSVLQVTSNQPFVSTASLVATSNANATLAVPFTTVLTPGAWKPRTPTSLLSERLIANNIDSPMTEQYNLDLQRQLPAKSVVELGYVGTRGTRLAESRNINLPLLASPAGPVNGITTNTVANAYLRVPYVGFGPAGLTRIETYGFSMYNSLQVSVRKEMSNGMQFQAAYTWGKTMTTVAEGDGINGVFAGGNGSINNPDIRSERYGPAGWDRANRLIAEYQWEIPGMRAGSQFVRTAMSGWLFSGVTTIQSGEPLEFTDPLGGSIYGNGSTSLAQFAPGASNHNILNRTGPTRTRLKSYLNASAFSSAALPVIGNGTGFGNVREGAARGPGQNNWDAALTKTTHVRGLTDQGTIEFRSEFFNTFNHPQYSNPGTAVGTASFGVIPTASVAPRMIQFALKYTF
jgi:hypothetical protein